MAGIRGEVKGEEAEPCTEAKGDSRESLTNKGRCHRRLRNGAGLVVEKGQVE